MSLQTDRPLTPSGAGPAGTPLCFARCQAGLLLAYGLVVMTLASAPPALALRREAPEVAWAIVAFTLGGAAVFAAAVLTQARRWLTTTVTVTDQAVEVRRTPERAERVRLVDIRRMRAGSGGLVILSASGRETIVGRLRKADAMRLAARLETRTGVPVEEG